MAKAGGGTRNYSSNARVMASRRNEYDGLLATGNYDVARSAFDGSGGFYITHRDHNFVEESSKDKSETAIRVLSEKGYRVYLDSEKTTISDNGKKRDGHIEKLPMDIKTINSAGDNTVQRLVNEAAKQNARAVIIYQNTAEADEKYMRNQIYGEKGVIAKAPLRTLHQIDWIIVVGSRGSVHRHNLMKERWRRGL